MTSTRTIYERLAFLYDLDDVMCLGAKQHWRKKIVKELDVKGRLALDIATGTGRTAKILSKKNGRVIGVDFSRNMLKIARIRNRGRDNLALIQCNAEHLPFRNGTFDVVTCMCGMDTVCRPETVFSEAVRVLKLGGKIGMMYFTEPEGWLRYLDSIIKKFYEVVWHAGNVDVLSISKKHSLEMIRRYDLPFAEALVMEKCRERDSNARSSDYESDALTN